MKRSVFLFLTLLFSLHPVATLSPISPRLHAHNDTVCSTIITIPNENQCGFATKYCNGDDFHTGFINYIELYFCLASRIQAIFTIVIVLTLCFLGLGITASTFLSPNLYTMSKVLRLSHNLAGLTLLAVGNSSADVFSTYKALSIDAAGLALSELLGAAFFVLTVVIGTICITRPFHSGEMHIFRDAVFYFSIVALIGAIIVSGKITLAKSLCLFALYVLYVLVAFYSHVLLQGYTQDQETSPCNKSIDSGSADDTNEIGQDRLIVNHSEILHPLPSRVPILDSINHEDQKMQAEVESFLISHGIGSFDEISQKTGQNGLRVLLAEIGKHSIHSLDPAFIEHMSAGVQCGHLSPLRPASPMPPPPPASDLEVHVPLRRAFAALLPTYHKDTSMVEKYYYFLSFPVKLVLELTVPVREHALSYAEHSNDHHSEGFSLIDDSFCIGLDLKSYQIQIVPAVMFMMTINSVTFAVLKSYWPLVFGALALCSAFLPHTSLPSSRENLVTYRMWNYVGCIIGFVNAMNWISIFGSEIIGVLKTIAVLFNVKDDILGFTIFAMGNSIGDLVANLTIAWMGMPMMAFGACFGGPLLSLCALGLSSAIIIIKSDIDYIAVRMSPTLTLNLLALLIALGFLVATSWANLKLGKPIGFCLLMMWALTVVFTLVMEIKS